MTYNRLAQRYYSYAPAIVYFGYQNYGGHHYRGHHRGHHGWDRSHHGHHDRDD